ncbi:MAG: DUF397 domain-containing protein [Actinophytocola sp.]|uniref:DUF397 domain-containing protein n=1 Tax=Actinophytocola sp. TaxID=1872138 RepID=UPI0013205897|nr:DUF397 domain-containing protein [Actinophytocola sp.]MPZ81911.1 DUF397 domain-containing protein [Actinophytocola sp.]
MDTAPRPPRWRTSSFSSNGANCVEVSWRKASFSSNGSACVEVSHDLAAVRDSKNPEGPTLGVDLRRFVSVIREGQLDR